MAADAGAIWKQVCGRNPVSVGLFPSCHEAAFTREPAQDFCVIQDTRRFWLANCRRFSEEKNFLALSSRSNFCLRVRKSSVFFQVAIIMAA
jgi:hypothetical protein